VVVGQSEDRTRQVAARSPPGRREGVVVIDSEPLPQGWIGKPWACHQGARLATGEVLVFLDADTCLDKGGLKNIVDTYLEKQGVLSVQPYHRTGRFYEQLSAFFNVIMLAAMGAFTMLGRRIKPLGLFGPCVVVSRESYLASGGHVTVKGEVVEDLALGERFQEHELPVYCYGGQGAISFRMYPNGIREMVEGWSKGFAIGAGKTPLPLLLAIIAWIGSGISATVWTIEAVSSLHSVAIIAWPLAYLACVIQLYWMFARVGTFRFYTALLFPVPLLFFIGVFFRSVILVYVRRSVTWKGIAINIRGKAQES
jgi:4,4'-diaponeurosporenoate glycosyltransferase